MYVQFSFYYGLQSLGYQQQLNRVTTPQENQLYNARLNLHNSTPNEKRIKSPIDTNLSRGTGPISSATHVCTHPTSSTSRVCTRSVCTTTCVCLLNNQGFLSMKNSYPPQPSVTSTSIFHYPFCTITNHNTSMLSKNLLMLLNHTI